MSHAVRVERRGEPALPKAASVPPPDLLSRIDQAIMGALFDPTLDYGLMDERGRFEGKDLGRLLGRVTRNVVYSVYGPVQMAAFCVFHPLEALQRLPSWVLQNLAALMSLDAVISITGSSFGTAATLATVFGCVTPIHSLVVLAGFVAIAAKLLKTGKERGHHGLLLWLESFLTGAILGLGTAWMLRRRFAERLQALKTSAGEKLALTGSESGFVNADNQAVLVLDTSQAGEFLNSNPAHDKAFATYFRKNHGWRPYDPSRVLVHEGGEVSVIGKYLVDWESNFGGGHTETYRVWSMSTSPSGLPSLELQSGQTASMATSAGVGLGLQHHKALRIECS